MTHEPFSLPLWLLHSHETQSFSPALPPPPSPAGSRPARSTCVGAVLQSSLCAASSVRPAAPTDDLLEVGGVQVVMEEEEGEGQQQSAGVLGDLDALSSVLIVLQPRFWWFGRLRGLTALWWWVGLSSLLMGGDLLHCLVYPEDSCSYSQKNNQKTHEKFIIQSKF